MRKILPLKILSFLRQAYLSLAILFVIYIAVSHYPELSKVMHYVNIIDISTFLHVIVLAFISYFFRSMRWLLYIRKEEKKANNLHHTIIYLSGFAFTASPGKSGELMRSTHLNHLHIPFSYTLACFLSERLLDVIIVLNLGIYAIVIITDNSLFFLLSLMLLALPFSFNSLLSKRWIVKYTQKIKLISHTLPLWEVNITFISMIFTVIAWSAQGAILYLFLVAIGEDITLLSAISIYSLSLLIGAASMIPGGLGVTELGMSWLLTQIGIFPDIALIAALFTRIFTLWPAMCIGIICSVALSTKNSTEKPSITV